MNENYKNNVICTTKDIILYIINKYYDNNLFNYNLTFQKNNFKITVTNDKTIINNRSDGDCFYYSFMYSFLI